MSELRFPPVENGLDYMESVVEHLASGPTPRDLKYAILHASAAIEVLLKARLANEHWSLVFKNVDDATEDAFDAADFQSVGLDATIGRLNSIAGVRIDDGQRRVINAVAKKRNQLQHHGLTDNVYAVQAVVSRALSFLLTFVDMHLRSGDQADSVEEVLDRIRVELSALSKFVEERMKEIRPAFGDSVVVTCPVCQQDAFVPGEDEGCRFCLIQLEGRLAADEYVGGVLHLSEYSVVKDGGEWPIHSCPGCDQEALVQGIRDCNGSNEGGADPHTYSTERSWACFSCGNSWAWSEVDRCTHCARPTVLAIDDGLPICDDCTQYWLSKD